MQLSELIFGLLTALAVVLVSGPLFIPVLLRLRVGQPIRAELQAHHDHKEGTPTMGGIMIVAGVVVSTLLFGQLTPAVVLALLVMSGFAFLGFLDDYIKVVLKRSLGLRARAKLAGQLLVAGVFAWAAVNYAGVETVLRVPVLEARLHLGLLYIPFAILVIIATSNAVNITDGLDGLAAGSTLFTFSFFAFVGIAQGRLDLAVLAAAFVGANLGFLRYNSYPARVIMGDTGSMGLGAGLASLAILTGTELLLFVAGGLFVIETLSVVIQVAYFRRTGGERIFRMSPIHYHFELGGWSEQQVVRRFWLFSLICSLAAFLLLKGYGGI